LNFGEIFHICVQKGTIEEATVETYKKSECIHSLCVLVMFLVRTTQKAHIPSVHGNKASMHV